VERKIGVKRKMEWCDKNIRDESGNVRDESGNIRDENGNVRVIFYMWINQIVIICRV